jgi:hypothetical protein
VVPVDIDQVLPRSYFDLLKLPFVAAHLGYVVGGEQDEAEDALVLGGGGGGGVLGRDAGGEPEESFAASPFEGTPRAVPTPRLEDSKENESASTAATAANAATTPGDANAAVVEAAASAPNATTSTAPTAAPSTTGAASSSPAAAAAPASSSSPPGSAALLDLASIDLDSVVLSSTGAAGGGGGGSRTLRPSGSANSLLLASGLGLGGSGSAGASGANSNAHLDELALGYDLLDELDAEGLGSAAPSAAAASGQGMPGFPGSGIAAGEDFFAGFYSGGLQLGLAPLAASVPAGAPFYRQGGAPSGRPGAIMVPPLPSASAMAASSSTAAAAAGTGASDAAQPAAGGAQAPATPLESHLSPSATPLRQASDGSASGRDGNRGGPGSATRGSAAGGGLSATSAAADATAAAAAAHSSSHSWSSLSSTRLPPVPLGLGLGYARIPRRIRINTSLLLMDLSAIHPCSPDLAWGYTLAGGSVAEVCRANQAVAEALHRWDLAATWSLAATICAGEVLHAHGQGPAANLHPWSENPMGGRLAEELIKQYLSVFSLFFFCFITMPAARASVAWAWKAAPLTNALASLLTFTLFFCLFVCMHVC